MKKTKNNKKYCNNVTIFKTRFKELMAENNIDRVDFAVDEMGVSKEIVDRYLMPSYNKFPPDNRIKWIADYFEVDTAYLRGEQECRRLDEARICEILNISEEAGANLEKAKSQNYNEVIEAILSNAQFDELASAIYEFSHAQYDILDDNQDPSERKIEERIAREKAIALQRISSVFDGILTKEYQKNEEKEKVSLYIKSARGFLSSTLYLIIEAHADKEYLIERIKHLQGKIQHYKPDSILVTTPAEEIIKNYGIIRVNGEKEIEIVENRMSLF